MISQLLVTVCCLYGPLLRVNVVVATSDPVCNLRADTERILPWLMRIVVAAVTLRRALHRSVSFQTLKVKVRTCR